MTTAERILTAHKQETYQQRAALENECRDLSIHLESFNCYDITYHFYDGSGIKKDRDGFSEI